MSRLLLLAALCGTLVGLPLCADDPPKKLTPEQRKELEAKWKAAMAAAGRPFQNGKVADPGKSYEEGLRLARQLYPKAEFPEGHTNLALSLDNLALLYRAQGKLAEAEPLLKEALDMNRCLFKGDHSRVATSLYNLAMLYHAQHKLAEAESLYKDALEMRKRLFKGDGLAVATSLLRLAELHQTHGKLAEAEPLYKDALEMYRRILKRDHADVARSLSGLAELYRTQGKPAEAEPLLKEALEMCKRLFKGDHLSLALSLHSLAVLYKDQGKLAEAEPLSKDAVDMYRRLFKGDRLELATSLNSLAELYRTQGKPAEAEPLLKESLEMYRRMTKGDDANLATNLNNLALLYLAQGKLTEAATLSKDAVDMYRRLIKGDHNNLASSLNTLAVLYHTQGKLAEAEPLCKDALEMRKRLFKGDHLSLALSLHGLAVLYKDQGKLAEAEPLFKDALAMCRRLTAAFAAEKGEGETLTFVGTLPGTRSSFLSAAARAKSSPETVYAEVWSDRSAVARIYEVRQHATRAATDPKAAKLVAELADTRRRRAELLLAPETRDPITRKQHEDGIKNYEKRIAELDRDIRPLLPAVERTERLGKATVAELQKVLPADAAVMDLLGYTHFEFDNAKPVGQMVTKTWRYTAFIITRDRITWVELDTAQKVHSAVLAWREAITSEKEIPAAIPTKVRELVWEKVRKELPANIKTVYIAPDQALCWIPWAALPGDKPGTILLEDFAIATIPHGTFLLDKLWPQDPIKNPPSGALVVGGVNYEAEATAGPANRDLPVKPGTKAAWQALPGAAAEATGVTSAAEKKKLAVTSLKGDAATPAAVLAALPKAKHAHFATHGFFADASFRSAFQLDPKDFERSLRGERIGRAALSPLVMTGLVFAGANNPKTPGRGIVTGEALVDLDLSGLELAVLSACETGLGDVAGGEGTFGLQRAFHLAGTRDVVASLWKVPDQPTAALMAEFYRNLWDKNLSPMESLRQAQLTIYRNPGKIAELAAGFRAGFKEVKGDETVIKPTAEGKTPTHMWAAFTLSGPGR